MSGSLSMPATGAVIQSVSQTKGAIGYVGLAYLSDRVKPIAVSYDEGKHYVLPTMENGTKSQPFHRVCTFPCGAKYYKKGRIYSREITHIPKRIRIFAP